MNVMDGIIWNIYTHPKIIVPTHFSIFSLVSVEDASEHATNTMSVELKPTNKEFKISLVNVDSFDANNLMKFP